MRQTLILGNIIAFLVCGSTAVRAHSIGNTEDSVFTYTKSEIEQIRARYGENKRIQGNHYDPSLAVKCVNGTFVGKKTENVIAFKGIPFVSEQPVGKNRFKKPVPFGKDKGIYEAYHFGKGALQPVTPDDRGSLAVLGEDCLYLNIWKNASNTADKKPVMVWIHGGGFTQGSTINPLYDGHNFVRDNGDVILVSIAYRLGGSTCPICPAARITRMPRIWDFSTRSWRSGGFMRTSPHLAVIRRM